jgi:hypothetical protein
MLDISRFGKIAGIIGAGALLFAPAAGSAADLKGEIVTADQHASLAAGAADIAGVHMHLHHTLNCLVGPSGTGFDAKEMNPCQNSGNGAIPDATDAATKQSLQKAATQASAGIGASDLATAKSDASSAAATLAAIK